MKKLFALYIRCIARILRVPAQNIPIIWESQHQFRVPIRYETSNYN